MGKKDKVEAEDLASLYDLAWGQFKEDRESVMEMYQDLKTKCSGSITAYEAVGDTLAKYAELMIKQTGQVVELIKLAHKAHEGDDGPLSAEDWKHISDEIEKEDETPTE